jgi:hypothetical protein
MAMYPMACKASSKMNYLTPVQMMYRTISRPSPSPSKLAPIAAPKKAITRADVDEIIQRRRSASAEELEEILTTKDLKLGEGERNQISVDLTILVAQRSRKMSGWREDESAKFISQVLGYAETPHGLIPRSFIADVLREGASNIQRCRLHRPPLCDCWSAQRAILWEARAGGEKTPEGWTASRLFDALEGLETSSRPERHAIPVQNTGNYGDYSSDPPSRSRWPTRTDSQ